MLKHNFTNSKSEIFKFLTTALLMLSSTTAPALDFDEKEAQSHIDNVMKQFMASSLEATYFISITNLEKNMIFSDNLFYQKDVVKVDYGFDFKDGPRIYEDADGKCVLSATVAPSKSVPIDRQTVTREYSDKDYEIKDHAGMPINVDVQMNINLRREERLYYHDMMKIAQSKITTMMDLFAKKYNCTLMLKFEQNQKD